MPETRSQISFCEGIGSVCFTRNKHMSWGNEFVSWWPHPLCWFVSVLSLVSFVLERVYTQWLEMCFWLWETHKEYFSQIAVNDAFQLDWINIEESGSDSCVLQCGICSMGFKYHRYISPALLADLYNLLCLKWALSVVMCIWSLL